MSIQDATRSKTNAKIRTPKKETIGLIGTGLIGSGLAKLSVAAGYNVVLSNSRGPASLRGLVAELGEQARAATVEETISASDIIIAPLPLPVYQSLPVDLLADKIVIDTMNYYPADNFHIADLDKGLLTSSELVQKHLKDSKVVKAFHNIGFYQLTFNASPLRSPERTTLPISGNDVKANKAVAKFINAIGYDTLDIGPLNESWRVEPGTPAYFYPYAPVIPQGLSDEEAKEFFLENKGAAVSPAEVQTMVNKAAHKFPVGGSFDMLPKEQIAAFIEFSKRRH